MIAAREGQHSGVVANASVKLVPPWANQASVRGMCSSVSMARWSSVTMTRMLGCEPCPVGAGYRVIGIRASRASDAAMRAWRSTVATLSRDDEPGQPGKSAVRLDLPGFEALGAAVPPPGNAVDHGSDALDVGVPPPVRPAVGVGDLHPEPGMPPADLADRCHGVTRVADGCSGPGRDGDPAQVEPLLDPLPEEALQRPLPGWSHLSRDPEDHVLRADLLQPQHLRTAEERALEVGVLSELGEELLEDVPDQRLRPEPQGDADDPGPGDQRPQVDVELPQQDQDRQRPHDHPDEVGDRLRERGGPLEAQLLGGALGLLEAVVHPADRHPGQQQEEETGGPDNGGPG